MIYAARRFAWPLVAIAALGACRPVATTPAESATTTAAAEARPASAVVPVREALDPAVLGKWQAYDTASFQHLGDLTVARLELRFAKGLTLAIEPRDGFVVIARSDSASPSPCGEIAAHSAVLEPASHPAPRSLKLTFFDVPTGPGSDPDFELHRCGSSTYVRG